MLEKHGWIAEDRHLFGVANSNYDFAAVDGNELGRRVSKLQVRSKKRINKNTLASESVAMVFNEPRMGWNELNGLILVGLGRCGLAWVNNGLGSIEKDSYLFTKDSNGFR